MAHEILYQLGIGGDQAFHTLTLVWEPHTSKVSLRFRNKREAANGMVGTLGEILEYLDARAVGGYPWDAEAPRAARACLAHLMGGAAPIDPLEKPAATATGTYLRLR